MRAICNQCGLEDGACICAAIGRRAPAPLLKTIDGRLLTREQAILEQRQMAETNPHVGRQPIPKGK